VRVSCIQNSEGVKDKYADGYHLRGVFDRLIKLGVQFKSCIKNKIKQEEEASKTYFMILILPIFVLNE
jgi:hypothetical protein